MSAGYFILPGSIKMLCILAMSVSCRNLFSCDSGAPKSFYCPSTPQRLNTANKASHEKPHNHNLASLMNQTAPTSLLDDTALRWERSGSRDYNLASSPASPAPPW